MNATNSSIELDRACDAFRIAIARNEFLLGDAIREGDRRRIAYYKNIQRWNSLEGRKAK